MGSLLSNKAFASVTSIRSTLTTRSWFPVSVNAVSREGRAWLACLRCSKTFARCDEGRKHRHRRRCRESSAKAADIEKEPLHILDPGNEVLQELVDKFCKIWSRSQHAPVACFYELQARHGVAVLTVLVAGSTCWSTNHCIELGNPEI